MNKVDPATDAELEIVWRDIESRADISCAVLTGAGEKAFCAGADLKGGDNGIEKSGLQYWSQSHPSGLGGISCRKNLDVPLIARQRLRFWRRL